MTVKKRPVRPGECPTDLENRLGRVPGDEYIEVSAGPGPVEESGQGEGKGGVLLGPLPSCVVLTPPTTDPWSV